MRRRAPIDPPSPFAEAEAAIVKRVAAGDLTTERAIESVAWVRTMACSRRARGLGRTVDRLRREAERVLADLRRAEHAERVAVIACVFYARHLARASDDRRRKESAELDAGGDDGGAF